MFSWMQAHSIMTPHNTRSLHGYYRAHVANKDAIAMLDLDQTFYMWKDYHISLHHQYNLMIT